MKRCSIPTRITPAWVCTVAFATISLASAQRPDGAPPGRGPGGPGFNQKREIVEKFDQNDDDRLNAEERRAAFESLQKEEVEGGNRRRRGPFGRGRGQDQEPPKPGPKVALEDVKPAGDADFYDMKTLRTLFFEFEDSDWEKQLIAFNDTDVEIPATLTVDGDVYKEVGVRVRGASSSHVGEGYQRPLNISIDYVHDDQRLDGYKTLNLHNSNNDPSMMRAVLYLMIARDYIPAAKANLVRVVINGENWGVYQNGQQINKEFIDEWFDTRKGARWKTPGSPRGSASLAYLGDDPEEYKDIYEIKSKDKESSWKALIQLCKVLTETPHDELKEKLPPLLDIDGALKFLALENALVNSDGYYTRTSDYYLYQDTDDVFHIIPHDVNETFTRSHGRGGGGGRGPRGFGPPQDRGERGERERGRPEGGPREGDNGPPFGGPGGPPFGGPGGPGGPEGSEDLDPLVAAKDESKLLIYKLLGVEEWRRQYLSDVREIAEKWLDWETLGPVAEELHALIADDVNASTRHVSSNEAFQASLTSALDTGDNDAEPRGRRGRPSLSLKQFADERRAYLLKYESTWKD